MYVLQIGVRRQVEMIELQFQRYCHICNSHQRYCNNKVRQHRRTDLSTRYYVTTCLHVEQWSGRNELILHLTIIHFDFLVTCFYATALRNLFLYTFHFNYPTCPSITPIRIRAIPLPIAIQSHCISCTLLHNEKLYAVSQKCILPLLHRCTVLIEIQSPFDFRE